MHDPRLDRLARVIVEYSVGVRRDDLVVLTGNTIAEPLLVLMYEHVVRGGGQPWIRLIPEQCDELLLRHGQSHQLSHTSPFDLQLVQQANVRISVWADRNSRALTNADPARQAERSKARRPILELFLKRAAKPAKSPDRLRWCGTALPTDSSAQDAEMSLQEYEDFVFSAGKLDQKDPVAAWKKLGAAQQRLADALNKVRELRFRAPGGTDLRVGVAGRRWINCDGHENFPDGEVFTGPVENATEGVVCYELPAVYQGREVEGVRLVFKAGKVVEASARKNEDFLLRMLDQDAGARILGEIALGTNYSIRRHTRNTLFDEKIGGTFHAALGASYPESGGKNSSALHWDMVCDLRKGGLIEADGKPLSRNGRFLKAEWPR